MQKQFFHENRLLVLAAAIWTIQPGIVLAQDTEAAASANAVDNATDETSGKGFVSEAKTPTTPLNLDTVVVTATANPLTSMRSSVAASIFTSDQIEQSAPRNAAEILNNVPGLLVQSSGGEGNANATARGLPLSGGAKLMQFQEDGLPVLDFGDIDFATADTFVRADYNLDRLEVIRGGSAATFASNAPGGVFNFISKTGEEAGGKVSLTRGMNYDHTRLDFDYGEPLGDGWRFHVGGFYRLGEGPRTVGYLAEDGGQIKGNVTHEFDTGYIRFNFKLLNDHAPVYLPVPISITGTTSSPHFLFRTRFRRPEWRHAIQIFPSRSFREPKWPDSQHGHRRWLLLQQPVIRRRSGF